MATPRTRSRLTQVMASRGPGAHQPAYQGSDAAMSFRKHAFVAALVLAVSPAWGAWNDPNIPQAREYRLFRFHPQAHVSEYEVKDFDSEKMVTAYDKTADQPATTEEVEGKVIRYRTEHKPTTSTLEIVRNYDTLLRGKGFESVVSGKGANLPGLGLGDDEGVGFYH